MWEPDTVENGGSVWLTPSTIQIQPKEGRYEKRKAYRESIGRHWVPGCLEEQVAMWPTPTTVEHYDKRGKRKEGGGCKPNLTTTIINQMWPTPRSFDKNEVYTPGTVEEKNGSFRSTRKKSGIVFGATITEAVLSQEAIRKSKMSGGHAQLMDAVKMWPTPVGRDCAGGSPNSKTHIHDVEKGLLRGVVYGEKTPQTARLSPLWVEWLMGFPKGWTDLNAWVTQWFPSRQD